MTRAEWYWAYHEIRLWKRENAPKFTLTIGLVSRTLKQVYSHSYTDEQSAFIRLTHRYREKITRQALISKLNRIRSWRKGARLRARDFMRGLCYCQNPFLAMLPKSEGSWSQPVIFATDVTEQNTKGD